MSTFKLPDLGEGLQEAEILNWLIKVGDHVKVDQPMLSVETAKAVVEVPAPYSGTVTALHAKAGDRLEIGAPLVDFNPDDASPSDATTDSGTVVGQMPAVEDDYAALAAQAESVATSSVRIRAVPAARALARSLGLDLSTIQGTGRGSLITLDDVMAVGLPANAPAVSSKLHPVTPVASHPDADSKVGELEVLRSFRRAMAQSMSVSRDSVMECTVFDDADLHHWPKGTDYTLRVLRAIACGCRAEPGLNAWYDEKSQSRRIFDHIDVGVAVDTPYGLIVPVVRDVGRRPPATLREGLERLKRAAHEHAVPREELRNFTFMLSNFGMMAGRYATPVVVPPAVAILGTGRAREDVVAVNGEMAIHRRMPLSLTFDHRVVTGGEAVRFLGAVIADLELVE